MQKITPGDAKVAKFSYSSRHNPRRLERSYGTSKARKRTKCSWISGPHGYTRLQPILIQHPALKEVSNVPYVRCRPNAATSSRSENIWKIEELGFGTKLKLKKQGEGRYFRWGFDGLVGHSDGSQVTSSQGKTDSNQCKKRNKTGNRCGPPPNKTQETPKALKTQER